MKTNLKKKIFAYGLFWSWNLLYLILFITLEYNIGLVYSILLDVFSGAPLNFTFSALMIYGTPFVSMLLGATLFRKDPAKLMKLFYGVEVPLTLLFLLRIWLIRELNPGTAHLSILLVVGMISYFAALFVTEGSEKKWLAAVRLVLNSVLLFVGAYAAILLLFYIPLAGGGIYHLLKHGLRDLFYHWDFIFIVIFLFVLYSLTLIAGLPFALIILYVKSFVAGFKNYTLRFSSREGVLITGSFFAVNLFLFYWLNWNQPQEGVLERLQASAWTKKQIAEFSDEQEEIREGLLNSYLASYRYLCAEQDNNNIRSLYRDVFGGERGDYAFLQSCNNVVLKPFLYTGKDIWQDHLEAEQWYEKLFESPIQQQEKASVRNALNATCERDQVEAGLLNIGEQHVLVTEQRLEVTEYGDLAEIELYEKYRNQTYEQQEVLYYFSLPENAVITGLWLSDDSTAKKFEFRVSPRGAAQRVYKNEVQRRVDPSLLEQVGPGQYRLRAFPVLPKTVVYDDGPGRRRMRNRKVLDGPELHLWLRYTVMKGADGSWALPQASQRRNVYCSGATVSKAGNQEMEKEEDEDWLPPSLKSSSADSGGNYTCALSDSMYVSASRLDLSEKESVPAAGSMALILDLSYSMKGVEKELRQTLKKLEEKKINSDIYLTGLNPAKPGRLNPDDLVFFGSSDPLSMLHQFDSLRGDKKYDRAFLLTDEGSYETGDDSLGALTLGFPLYVVHLGGKAPYAYQDNFLETLQKSGGKPVKNIEDAFSDIYMKNLYKNDTSFIAYENGWLWKSGIPDGKNPQAFKSLAVRQYINHLVRQSQDTGMSFLDQVHSLAVSNRIVTPYSSMIVLVDQRQHEALNRAEQERDRFKRETETGKEVLSQPDTFGFNEVSGTPEPEEWVLITIAGALLCYFALKRRLPGMAG